MLDWHQVPQWAATALAISPMLGAFLWVMWEGEIRPRFIPDAEIKSLADAHISKYGEHAAEMAFVFEDRAWRYSDSFGQGKWKRVRQEIERLSKQG